MAVMNYAAQSEMNIYLLSAIQKLVQDKGYGQAGLDGSIKVCEREGGSMCVLERGVLELRGRNERWRSHMTFV